MFPTEIIHTPSFHLAAFEAKWDFCNVKCYYITCNILVLRVANRIAIQSDAENNSTDGCLYLGLQTRQPWNESLRIE